MVFTGNPRTPTPVPKVEDWHQKPQPNGKVIASDAASTLVFIGISWGERIEKIGTNQKAYNFATRYL